MLLDHQQKTNQMTLGNQGKGQNIKDLVLKRRNDTDEI
jgi:hypothetical protein